MTEQELLEKAIGIAVEAHRSQKDRYGAPYILHPLRVMARLTGPVPQTVGVLHDVVEDTDWTLEQLRQEGFQDTVLRALDRVTKRDGERYEDYIQRSANDPVAREVKLADLEDNMDVRRLPAITDQDRQRLQRYLTAWNYLKASGPEA